MKNVVSFIFLLALLVSGCSQEEMSKNGTSSTSEGRVFTTSFEQNDSRTYVKDGHLSRWTEGDCISLFDASILNCQYLFAGDTGDSGGTFFMLSKPEGTGTALSTNYAVYPYSEDVKMTEDGVISVTLPSEQHYAENSYGLGDNIMVAVTENADDTFLKFKNVGGCFKLQLYGDNVTVKSITLKGNNGEKIAGKATITATYNKAPAVTMVEEAITSITLDCGKTGVKIGASAEKATAFWVVVPPTTFEEGITVMVTDMSGKVFVQTTEKELLIERNVVQPMAAIKVEPENPQIAYSEDEEELEGWSAGLFGGEGTYIMGKPHGDNGYLMMVGNVLEGKGALVFMDSSRQLREIFFDNTIITFGENTDGNVDVSIMEKGYEEIIEHIHLPYNNFSSRSIDHSQKVGIFNLLLNWEGLIETIIEINKEGGLSKKGALMLLANYSDSIRNLVKALGGPDIFNETFSDWLGNGMNIVSLIELGELYKKLPPDGKGKAVFVCALVYTGFAVTYYELYNERIETCYGNTVAEIENVTYENKSLNIKLKVSGYDNLNNLECGVIVSHPNILGYKLWSSPVGIDTRTVTMDENYLLSVGDIDLDETYLCVPFLIRKDRYSMWKGFLGEYVGPMVRYGKTVSYKTPCPSGKLVNIEQIKRNSAVVRCQYTNVESGVECGIIIVDDEGKSRTQTVATTEDEQVITISGLEPLTEYTCTSYVRFTKINGEVFDKGNSLTFKTLPPDISGTWNCQEGTDSYTLTLKQDGSATCSLYDDIATGSWSINDKGVVTVGIMTIATNTFNSGVRWTGPVDNVKNPKMIVGSTYNWNFNQNGYYQGNSRKMIMTR